MQAITTCLIATGEFENIAKTHLLQIPELQIFGVNCTLCEHQYMNMSSFDKYSLFFGETLNSWFYGTVISMLNECYLI